MSQDPKQRKRRKNAKEREEAADLSLYPLTLDEALSGAMQTGRPPDRQKRSATKRKLKGEDGKTDKKDRPR